MPERIQDKTMTPTEAYINYELALAHRAERLKDQRGLSQIAKNLGEAMLTNELES